MAHAYTPGLKVSKNTLIRKTRRLPLQGEVFVKVGDHVQYNDVIAKTELPGKVYPMNVANRLNLLPKEVPQYLLKKEGDRVRAKEIIAEKKGLFGLFTTRCESPMDGFIESISEITGQVLIRGNPNPVEVKAYIDGEVVEVIEKEGAVIENRGTLIQGIFGIGKEKNGPIHICVDSPEKSISLEMITEELRGKIIVAGSYVTADIVTRACETGVLGIIAGGIDYKDIKDILGYEVGVAITGNEDIVTTLIITEGFGKITMAEKTFQLLQECEGMMASINGATQIRAGVIRPEIVIIRELEKEAKEQDFSMGIQVGSLVRGIRTPYFGRIGRVTALPHQPTTIETESKVRILEVEFLDGEKAILPRANVEQIEE